MITTAVVCPHPPVLLRELAGLADPVADLRDACAEALRSALAEGPETVVVVGGAAATGRWQPSVPLGVRRFGTTTARDATYLPQSLSVARRLLDEAGWDGPLRLHAVAWDAGAEEVAAVAGDVAGDVAAVRGRTVLVVMADGSARRGEKAPGHLDERAFAYDDEIGRALEEGDAAALIGLDAPLAADLLVQGRAALAVLGTTAAPAVLGSTAAPPVPGTTAAPAVPSTTAAPAVPGTTAAPAVPRATTEAAAEEGAAQEGPAQEGPAQEGPAQEGPAQEGPSGNDLDTRPSTRPSSRPSSRPRTRLHYRADPYGVMYTVATWSFTP